MRLVKNTRAPMTRPWPDDCLVQGSEGKFRHSDKPAFIEAYPTDPQTMIRADAATVAEAEEQAYVTYLRYLDCPKHDYEPGNYKNGSGICRHCKLWSAGVFTLEEVGAICAICSTPTNWRTIAARQVCEDHAPPSWADFWLQVNSWAEEGADTSELGILGWIVPYVDIRDFVEVGSAFDNRAEPRPITLYANACVLWLDDQVRTAR